MAKSSEALMNKCREIDQNLGNFAERISLVIWPWRELWLLIVVGILIVSDFASTYALLALNRNAYESGRLAIWALARGGFPFLFVIDITAAAILLLAALVSRRFYLKHGFPGYGRAAFVFILMPYIAITIFAVVNNIILQFR